MPQIRVIRPLRLNRQIENGVYVNCTSSGDNAERQLSPFYLGPCELYDGYTAQVMENAWQYSKVYPEHLFEGFPTADYFEWAEHGWASPRANRYPMGRERNAGEVTHWWSGEALSKVQARKRIYVPLYCQRVIEQPFFKQLKKIGDQNKEHEEFTLYLMDFDAYEYGTMSLYDILNEPQRSMGHGFVLAMLLTDDAALKECELR